MQLGHRGHGVPTRSLPKSVPWKHASSQSGTLPTTFRAEMCGRTDCHLLQSTGSSDDYRSEGSVRHD